MEPVNPSAARHPGRKLNEHQTICEETMQGEDRDAKSAATESKSNRSSHHFQVQSQSGLFPIDESSLFSIDERRRKSRRLPDFAAVSVLASGWEDVLSALRRRSISLFFTRKCFEKKYQSVVLQ